MSMDEKLHTICLIVQLSRTVETTNYPFANITININMVTDSTVLQELKENEIPVSCLRF